MTDIWDELVEKYDISGYTDSLIILKYETLKKLHERSQNLYTCEGIAKGLLEDRGACWDQLKDIREIIKNAPGGVLKDDHTPKNVVKTDTFMRYYRAICEISGIVGSQHSTETQTPSTTERKET